MTVVSPRSIPPEVKREPCGTCTHPAATHVAFLNACQLNGCRCERFVGKATVREDGPRQVTFTIPDGYGFSVSFWPFTESAEVPDGS